ncbi:hypothetical protein [Chryseobacterium sp. MEBOG07]|uniref:hypothetical protein n=1 Tax=Chryseobacterium sp. MEBOG07 TaxID=2879939 RepID=UPI001F442053|nr:hypothetical protein [Chryseobacterium sp. MEBOG07]UKB81207.1 hypothetical protein LF886_09525 [Chryseobacterium sp. MEBOG07]
MTKKLLIVAFTGLSCTMAFAADLYVRNGGAGGAYPTVSTAITAASDGDRIIIQPKANGEAYVENLIINKSLTFVSETHYTKYIIQGNVSINPATGRTVTISNLSSGYYGMYNVEATFPIGTGRTIINIVNCDLHNVLTDKVNFTTNISGCTISGILKFSHGRCTANKAQSIAVIATQDSSPVGSDIEVYGNVSSSFISNSQSNYNFKFNNNFCAGIYIYGLKAGSSNEIINNTVYNYTPADTAPFYVNLGNNLNVGNIAIINNASSFVVGGTNACIQNKSNNVAITANYNVFTNTFVTEGNMTQSDNSGSMTLNFDNAAYTVTGMNVNAGNPGIKYTDLDLTRNDAGHYGGSNSWMNYWPANNGNKPQVNYLSTPRSITSGTFNLSGSGFSK